jgi:hypothetical protein
MRWAKSYSIIDHQILHGGYLHRLSHEAMILYLFLVVVGDREGRSFYSDTTIMDILRLDSTGLSGARLELEVEGLIYCRGPYYFVRNIEAGKEHAGGCKRKDIPEVIKDLAKDCLKDIPRRPR